ncbi:AAA family ATPase [Bacteriovorax sp. PP10]|uniref:AAA family ATPase n=1 Tax=Bacteriovorax antarcticus TaxID=3088717 RepID=A0ABU5VSX5_9BACT|nr:AAA family ATPase [Bacteriovorax sp. PP10]MEA9355697.1 AAA family ATPase [Bacteriovorax sp. PP10]
MINETRATSVWDIDPISSLIQRIHFKHTTKGLRSISILSEKRSEGKTTTAMLLARGLSEVYKFKILLIDLNPDGDALLNQYLQKYEAVKTQDGMVVGHPFDFSIFRIKNIDMNWLKTAYDGLYANQLINGFSNEYDLVIVDTMTSSNPNDNALRVSTHSNIIVSSEKSFGRTTNKLQTELEQNRKEVLGVIFNK